MGETPTRPCPCQSPGEAALTQLNPAQQHEMETWHPEFQLWSKGRSLGVSSGPLSFSSSCPATGPCCATPEGQQSGGQAGHGGLCLLLWVLLPTVSLGGVPWGHQKHPVCLFIPHPVFTEGVCTPWVASAPSFPPLAEVHQEEGLGSDSSRTGPPRLLDPVPRILSCFCAALPINPTSLTQSPSGKPIHSHCLTPSGLRLHHSHAQTPSMAGRALAQPCL